MLLLLFSFGQHVQRFEDRAAKLRRIEPALDLAALHKRNQTGLFRNHYRHRIRVFRHADRRAMPRSEISREPWIECQRQKARSSSDAMPSHDNRAIVKRTRCIEDTDSKS